MAEDTVRVWLVDRTVTEKPTLINHVYAVASGDRYYLTEQSIAGASDDAPTRAALEVEEDDLLSVEDEEIREEYASVARRTAEQHQPDDPV